MILIALKGGSYGTGYGFYSYGVCSGIESRRKTVRGIVRNKSLIINIRPFFNLQVVIGSVVSCTGNTISKNTILNITGGLGYYGAGSAYGVMVYSGTTGVAITENQVSLVYFVCSLLFSSYLSAYSLIFSPNR